jgi:autotransporter-associated beta strand protein
VSLSSSANTYTGPTTVNGGILRLTGTGTVASLAIVTGADGTFSTSGRTSLYALASGQTVSGVGTLQVGSTSVTGLAVGSGAALSPGTVGTTGTLTLAQASGSGGQLTMQSGGRFQTDIAAGGTSDSLVVGASSFFNFATGSVLDLRGIAGFNPAAVATYNLATSTAAGRYQLNGTAQADGTVFGSYIQGTGASGAVVLDVSNLGFTLVDGDSLVFRVSGNNLVLEFTPVPEPTVVGLLAAGLLGAVRLARRRPRTSLANGPSVA